MTIDQDGLLGGISSYSGQHDRWKGQLGTVKVLLSGVHGLDVDCTHGLEFFLKKLGHTKHVLAVGRTGAHACMQKVLAARCRVIHVANVTLELQLPYEDGQQKLPGSSQRIQKTGRP